MSSLADALSARRSFAADKYGPGLQDVSVPDAMAVYGLGKAALGVPGAIRSVGPLNESLGEMGAIFPEGMPIPKDKTLAQELGNILPESQRLYRGNEALANWHAENQDWPRVLADKWALLKNSGGN